MSLRRWFLHLHVSGSVGSPQNEVALVLWRQMLDVIVVVFGEFGESEKRKMGFGIV